MPAYKSLHLCEGGCSKSFLQSLSAYKGGYTAKPILAIPIVTFTLFRPTSNVDKRDVRCTCETRPTQSHPATCKPGDRSIAASYHAVTWPHSPELSRPYNVMIKMHIHTDTTTYY